MAIRVAPVHLHGRHHLNVNCAHGDENLSRRTMVVSTEQEAAEGRGRYKALCKGQKRALVSNTSAFATDWRPATVQQRTVRTTCSGLSDQHNLVLAVSSGVCCMLSYALCLLKASQEGALEAVGDP